MTWWLWLVAALGAVVLIVLLGLGLWRRGRELLRALTGAGALAERLAPSDAAGDGAQQPAPPALARPTALTAALEQRGANLSARRLRRRERAALAAGHWRRLGLR